MNTLQASNQPDKNAPSKDPGHKDKPGQHKEGDKSKNQDKDPVKKPVK